MEKRLRYASVELAAACERVSDSRYALLALTIPTLL